MQARVYSFMLFGKPLALRARGLRTGRFAVGQRLSRPPFLLPLFYAGRAVGPPLDRVVVTRAGLGGTVPHIALVGVYKRGFDAKTLAHDLTDHLMDIRFLERVS